jgi:peptidoglycan/LPS O-acetylase OafA/YrhL
MYLTHPFALVVGVYLMPHAPVVLQLAIEMLVIAAASVGAYHLLEKPMIDLGARLAQKAEFRYEQVAMSSEL